MTTSAKTLLSRELRTEMWLALSARLGEGEALYSNEQFRVALLECYEQITGQTAPAVVEEEVTAMVETVNREHPETYLAHVVQNGIAKAFEEGVRRQNWDLARIQPQSASTLRRLSQQDAVRDLLRTRRSSVTVVYRQLPAKSHRAGVSPTRDCTS